MYVINLYNRNTKGTHWVSLFIHKNVTIYFHSFPIKYIPQKILNKVRNKSIAHNIYRIQDNESIIFGFSCIGFIEYMLVGKTLLDYSNLLFPNDYKNNKQINMYVF